MGQFALGIRSLLIKLAVFVVLASLLAWALGGTLFPRPEIVRFDPVSFDGRQWHWQLSVGGKSPGEARWQLMVQSPDDKPSPFDDRHWAEAGPLIVRDSYLYYAARDQANAGTGWRIERIDQAGQMTAYPMPDRLAVEQQLGRLAAGLDIQPVETIAQQRAAVLDPKPHAEH